MSSAVRWKVQIALVAVAVLLAALMPLSAQRAKARVVNGPVRIGASFSPRRAAYLGLDWQDAYRQVLGLHFKVIRLGAYWDEVDQDGYDSLDWLMAASEQAGQPVVLSVGMKSLGWPEFYIPSQLQPPAGERDGGDVTSDDQTLRDGALDFLSTTVARYRGNPVLVAWQVENEPFNRAGPQRWWIGREFLEEEIATVKNLDSRPVIVNVFSHFNRQLDAASRRHGFDLRQFLGFEVDSAENDTLQVLGVGDILGMDVYTRIGYRSFGQSRVSKADDDWDDHVARWRAQAARQNKYAWVTEAQAEPWEADSTTYFQPRSFGPQEMLETFHGLKEAGYQTILLWGVEYWLAKAATGDRSWLDAARSLLNGEKRAAALTASLA